MEELDLHEFFTKKHEQVNSSHIEDLHYILTFSDIKLVEESLFINYLTDVLNKLKLDATSIYNLKKLDKSLQLNKKVFYKDEYERSFNLLFGNNSLFQSESDKNKYFTLSFCQFLINDKLNNNERSNYLLGKILRQCFYSNFDISFKEKLLFNAYYYQSNQFQQNTHPFKFVEKLEIIDENLPENPNCFKGNNDDWILIKDSYDKKNVIEVKALKKEFNGFVVDYKGIEGFLPFNHITEKALKYYSYSKVDFTLTVYCILISEEFNFFCCKTTK